jgi:polysaccharide deacetylase
VIRVLTYHSHNIFGDGYDANDHVALAADLQVLEQVGARIVPLEHIAELVRARQADSTRECLVGLSFDDGPVFDVHDFVHARFGMQRGFAGILRDFSSLSGRDAPATSFVIASPDARRAMERAPQCGFPEVEGWLDEAWWSVAAQSRTWSIGNHSWDHVHEVPEVIAADLPARNNFALVDHYVAADAEISRASRYINARVEGTCRLFAYPFGHVNRFLVEEYFPQRTAEHGMTAAFSVGVAAITSETSPWNIPRLVCGEHWRSADGLAALLREN